MRKTFVLAVAAVALTGCGMVPTVIGGGGEEKQAATQPAAATSTSPSVPADDAASDTALTDQDAAPTPEAAESAPPQADSVIATHTAKVRGSSGEVTTVKIDITELRRQGRTAVLRWTITTLEGRFNLHSGLGRGALDYSVSAVSLVDPVNAKRYRVARNGSGDRAACICSATQGAFMEKGERTDLYAFYAAPPPDVTKLTVEMPRVGVITDVPVS